MPVVFGDASHEVVLEAAGVHTASLLLVTTPGVVVARAIVVQSKRLCPELDVVVNAADRETLPVLRELAVTSVVLPGLETGVEMARQALAHLRVSTGDILRHTEKVRREQLGMHFRPSDKARTLAELRSAELQLELQWVRLASTSRLVGRSIGECEIRKTTGASVVGIRRSEAFEPNPAPAERFEASDLVAVIGTERACEAFRDLARPRERPAMPPD
jgi:CPA2 family monovalent cation:H+ antiporter-2